MKFPGKITIHILPDTSKLNLKSQMSVFIMLNKKTVFSFLSTFQQKAINMLLHNCKTFSLTLILLYPETQEVTTALS